MIISMALYGTAGILALIWIALVLFGFNPGSDPAAASSTFLIKTAAAIGPLALLALVVVAVQTAVTTARIDRVGRTSGAHARRASEEAEISTRTLMRMQELARARAFQDSTELVLKDLNAALGVIAERGGLVDRDEAETLWALTAAGNPWALAEDLMMRLDEGSSHMRADLAASLVHNPGAGAALHRFMRRYDALLKEAKEHDGQALLVMVLEDGPMDRLRLHLGETAKLLESLAREKAAQPKGQRAVAGSSGTGGVRPPTPPQRASATMTAPDHDETSGARPDLEALAEVLDASRSDGPEPKGRGRAGQARSKSGVQPVSSPPVRSASEEDRNALSMRTLVDPSTPLTDTATGLLSAEEEVAPDEVSQLPNRVRRPQAGPAQMGAQPPYPPLRPEDIQSIQSRVANSLSQSVLSSRAAASAPSGTSSAQTPQRTVRRSDPAQSPAASAEET